MTYELAIPSAGRAELIVRKTLPMLDECKVPMHRVTVWVANEQEADAYWQQVRPFGVNVEIAPHDPKDGTCEKFGVEPVGIGKSRNHIIRQHAVGTNLAFIDDDITAVKQALDTKTLAKVDDLDALFRRAFLDLDASSATLWGISPVANPYFMRPRLRYDLCYICAGLFAMKVTGKEYEMVVLDDKEDLERSCRHYLADGRVLRDDRYCLGTTVYAGAGGLQMSRTTKQALMAAEWLMGTFPGLVTMNNQRKSPYAEVRLRDRRK